MELLDIVNGEGIPTGETKERTLVHRDGDRHRTCHVWLLRHQAGAWQVLLQRRSDTKDSHPGCFDISSAGHIPAGVDWIPSALRELEEELGIRAAPEELHFAGLRRFSWEGAFYGQPFRDNQVSRVYYMLWDGATEELHLQESEVSGVRWMNLEACREAVVHNEIPHCIFPEELDMVAAALERE